MQCPEHRMHGCSCSLYSHRKRPLTALGDQRATPMAQARQSGLERALSAVSTCQLITLSPASLVMLSCMHQRLSGIDFWNKPSRPKEPGCCADGARGGRLLIIRLLIILVIALVILLLLFLLVVPFPLLCSTHNYPSLTTAQRQQSFSHFTKGCCGPELLVNEAPSQRAPPQFNT